MPILPMPNPRTATHRPAKLPAARGSRTRHRPSGTRGPGQRRLDVTSVYVTHDQMEAMTWRDRIAVLKKGAPGLLRGHGGERSRQAAVRHGPADLTRDAEAAAVRAEQIARAAEGVPTA